MEEIISEGLRLQRPSRRVRPASQRVPGLVLLAGFPRGAGGAAMAGQTYPPLAERIARESGWAALDVHVPGHGHVGRRLLDRRLAGRRARRGRRARGAARHQRRLARRASGSAGRSRSSTAAGDDRVRGLATFAAPASLRAWVRDPEWFLEYARRGGRAALRRAIPPIPSRGCARSPTSTRSRPRDASTPRPWLLVHGCADDVVPVEDARRLAVDGGDGAELRIVQNGGHRLRHDPRAIAMLLGWLDRRLP